MSAPTMADLSALLRSARYFVLQPRAVYSFPWQDAGAAICAFMDTDSAGCFCNRRSGCGGSACV
eukprot:6505117-Alexandrium_andersonii.AAC.1